MSKKIVDIPIEVDEVALATRGWHAKEARARLTSDLWHDLSISVTLELAEKEWSGRYRHEDWLSPVILEVSHPTLGDTMYIDLHVNVRDALRKRTARISSTGTISYKSGSIDPSALRLKLISLDGGSPMSSIEPFAEVGRRVAVDLVDESSCAEFVEHVINTGAFVSKGGDPDEVVVTVKGKSTCRGDYQQLVDFTEEHAEWIDRPNTFSVDLPDVEVDLLDGTDFLLGRYTEYLTLAVKGRKMSDVPSRSAEWLSVTRVGVDDLPGEVAKVVVRLTDPD